MLDPGQKIKLNDLHLRLGHAHEAVIRQTAKEHGWVVTGSKIQCVECGLGKARKKSVNKEAKRSKVKGERLFIDISSIKSKSYSQSKFWLRVLDDHTDYAWSFFLKKKKDLTKMS